MFYNDYFCKTYKGEKHVYSGRLLLRDLNDCICIISGKGSECQLLRCNHKKVNDRILFHISHTICDDKFRKVIIATRDTDIFISALYHMWILDDLKGLWMLRGQGSTNRTVLIHEIPNVIDLNILWSHNFW